MSFLRKGFLLTLVVLLSLSGNGLADSSYDRDLVVQDKTRATQVEAVFKDLMGAYEFEDAGEFLDLVSDERFRQDYITFTDALYSDFRTYEIHHVDYWIDRIVPDHIKQFLYVRWEKRYENLDDGEQFTTRGYSRFLFDEVNGKYLLIELAGNNLFGGSLQEWVDEVPPISGQESIVSNKYPDLVIENITWMPTSSDGTAGFTIRNAGKTKSGSCEVYVEAGDKTIRSSTQSVSGLAPGESSTTYSVYLSSFDHPNLKIIVDSGSVVKESNEINNTYIKIF